VEPSFSAHAPEPVRTNRTFVIVDRLSSSAVALMFMARAKANDNSPSKTKRVGFSCSAETARLLTADGSPGGGQEVASHG
jgi:hypothetical protein